jgi:Holliday junction resolvase RusA-like endonuclease
MTTLVYELEPMGKVRMSQRDKWAKRPVVVRYRAYHDRLRELGVTLKPGDEVHFELAMPKSWNSIKRGLHAGEPHMQKPDLDNLLGGLLDGVLEEDKMFWCFGCTSKRWTTKASTITIIRKRAAP